MPPARKKRACNAQEEKVNTNVKKNNNKKNPRGKNTVSNFV
jgi:hypothetical protein